MSSGNIVQIIGAVVDVEFPSEAIPKATWTKPPCPISSVAWKTGRPKPAINATTAAA